MVITLMTEAGKLDLSAPTITISSLIYLLICQVNNFSIIRPPSGQVSFDEWFVFRVLL
jgi:hypothetical protein